MQEERKLENTSIYIDKGGICTNQINKTGKNEKNGWPVDDKWRKKRKYMKDENRKISR